jgi:hypothetical protein
MGMHKTQPTLKYVRIGVWNHTQTQKLKGIVDKNAYFIPFVSHLLTSIHPHSPSSPCLHLSWIFRLPTTHPTDKTTAVARGQFVSRFCTSWLSLHKTDIPFCRKAFTFWNKKTPGTKNENLLRNGLLWLGEELRSSNKLCWLLLAE